MPRLMPLGKAAAELGLHRNTIYRLVRDGRIKRYKKGIGRSTYVDLDEVRPLLKPVVSGPVASRKPKP